MIYNGEEFNKKLESFSDDTMRLISSFDQISKELAQKALDIVATTDTEQEVVGKLQKLLKEQKKEKYSFEIKVPELTDEQINFVSEMQRAIRDIVSEQIEQKENENDELVGSSLESNK